MCVKNQAILAVSGWWCRASVRSCVRRIIQSVATSRMNMQYRVTSAVSQQLNKACSVKRLFPSLFNRRRVRTHSTHCDHVYQHVMLPRSVSLARHIGQFTRQYHVKVKSKGKKYSNLQLTSPLR